MIIKHSKHLSNSCTPNRKPISGFIFLSGGPIRLCQTPFSAFTPSQAMWKTNHQRFRLCGKRPTHRNGHSDAHQILHATLNILNRFHPTRHSTPATPPLQPLPKRGASWLSKSRNNFWLKWRFKCSPCGSLFSYRKKRCNNTGGWGG